MTANMGDTHLRAQMFHCFATMIDDLLFGCGRLRCFSTPPNFLMDKKKTQTVSELKSCVLCTENIWACERACQRACVLNMLHVTLNILAVTLLSGGCGTVTSTAEQAYIWVLFNQ